MVLALGKGGCVNYFGEIGENGQTVIDYFAARGKCDRFQLTSSY